MTGIENLYFSSPWLLATILFLPLLWWILKVLPPKPKKHGFGGAYFLEDLTTTEKTSQTTPWWILLIRTLAILCFILAFAAPQEKTTKYQPSDTPLLIIIDNDWASSQQWQMMQNQARLLIEENMDYKQNVAVLTTTPFDEQVEEIVIQNTRKEALENINSLHPIALEARYDRILNAFERSTLPDDLAIFYFNNNVTTQKELNLLNHLDTHAALTLFDQEQEKAPLYWFSQKQNRLVLQRLYSNQKSETVQIHVKDDKNALLASLTKNFEEDSSYIDIDFSEIPNEIAMQMRLLTIDGQKHAAAHYWQKSNYSSKSIGIITSSTALDIKQDDYLNPYLYLQKALSPYHHVALGTLPTLIEKSDVLILADTTQLSNEDVDTIEGFIQHGGIFIRFADSYLAKGDLNELSPVELRNTDREFESVLSWQTPQHLTSFPENSPFAYLAVPDDISVSKQIVATPSLDLLDKALALLEDGTPLITAKKDGQGWMVLYHVSATPEWSTLPLSGLFLKQLRILVDLSSAASQQTTSSNKTIKLKEQIDAYGDLVPAQGNELPLTLPLSEDFSPSTRTPIGIYGNAQIIKNINLGDYLKIHSSTLENDVRTGFTFETYKNALNIDYKPYLLMLACFLFLCDLLYIALFNRGFISLVFLAFLTVSAAHPAQAQSNNEQITSATYLGYIKTGDPHIDRLSQRGLETLMQETIKRTSADLAGVSAIDIMTDSLQPYPLIYWPVTSNAHAYPTVLPRDTVEKIQHYFDKGGILLIDTRDQYGETNDGDMTYGANTQIMKRLFYHMQTPPMIKLPGDHVLTRSFYLLSDLPGLYKGTGLWIAVTPQSKNDGVTPLIIGGNDWISAWAKNDRNIPIIPISGQHGEQQREHAYRFGVNLILYALTGNYKDDQMHIPFILERLDH